MEIYNLRPRQQRQSPVVDIAYEKAIVSTTPSCFKYRATDKQSGAPITILRWAKLMSKEGSKGDLARDAFMEVIKSTPFKAMFFETRGTSKSTYGSDPFTFVLIDSPDLHYFGNDGGDAYTFKEHFLNANDSTGAIFDNLGKDARLIAPLPPSERTTANYAHLANFVREAPKQDVMNFLGMMAEEYLHHLDAVSPKRVWLSTSGLGVAWLHFRLDSYPKYYQHRPYSSDIEAIDTQDSMASVDEYESDEATDDDSVLSIHDPDEDYVDFEDN